MKKTIITIFLIIIMSGMSVPYSFAGDDDLSFRAGVSEYRNGNYEKAINIMDKLIEIDPNNSKARYYLAISLVKQKRFNEAKQQYIEIIANSEDKEIIEYAKKGLKLLDPKYYKKLKKSNFTLTQNTSRPDNTTETRSHTTVISPEQQEKLNQIAQTSNVSTEEINNLINLLAKNPSALNTITKLANSKDSDNNNNASDPDSKNFDPQSVAQLIQMLTLNNQANLLNFDKKDNKNNNSMDLMNMMSGMGGPAPGGGQPNSMNQLMEYLNDPSNKGKINPEMINNLFKQNMMDFSSTGY